MDGLINRILEATHSRYFKQRVPAAPEPACV